MLREGAAGLSLYTHQISSYLRMRVIVSLRSFPWNGREPVSISNCEGERTRGGHIYEQV